jgi:predicted PurR-regulated permease PerM
MVDGDQSDIKGGWRERIVKESFGQGGIFVVLLLILVAIGWLGYYSVTSAIPSHLESIKDGYTEIANKFDKSLDKMVNGWEKDAARDQKQNEQILAKLEELNRTTKDNRPIISPPAKSVENHP